MTAYFDRDYNIVTGSGGPKGSHREKALVWGPLVIPRRGKVREGGGSDLDGPPTGGCMCGLFTEVGRPAEARG